jgi:3-oxoacyl-[acyl-carrier protein] reductase
MEFKGKSVIVTGSTRGIGYGIARKFAELGANVLICGTTEKVFGIVDEFKRQGLNAAGFAGDISHPDVAQALVDKAVEEFGAVDVLVNNAGITCDKLLIKMEPDDWDRVMDTNLKSAYLVTRAAVKVMMKKKKGSIINISSVVGLMGNSSQANYAASKAGLIGFTKSVAKEYARRGITCNALAPGFIETEMTGSLPEEVKEYYLRSIPLGRPGTTSDVADLAVFLASDKAQYITGQVINIDGGLHM